jgi:hypothetical protein
VSRERGRNTFGILIFYEGDPSADDGLGEYFGIEII